MLFTYMRQLITTIAISITCCFIAHGSEENNGEHSFTDHIAGYSSISITGSAVESRTVELTPVSPGNYIGFLKLTEGTYKFNAVKEGGTSVEIGVDKKGNLAIGGNAINVNETKIVRLLFTSNIERDSYSLTNIESLYLKGSIVPANTILNYVGNGVWSSTVKLDNSNSIDYNSNQFYFLINNDEDLAIKRVKGTPNVFMPIDGFSSVEPIRLNPGEFNITLNMRDFTFSIDSNIDEYKISAFGSSVANGQGADNLKGYAYQYGQQLQKRYKDGLSLHNFYTSNVAIGGNNTIDLLTRYDDIIHDFGKYVMIGLSLGNEGIHDNSNQESVFNQFRDNMEALIGKLREDGKVPIVINNYTRSDYNESDYKYVKDMDMLIHCWDLPSVNVLGAIDDGAGHWTENYIADAFHPNTAGHSEFMYAMVPSLFDALHDGKALPERNIKGDILLGGKKTVSFTPEGIVHPFTVCVRVKGDTPGNVISFANSYVAVEPDGTIKYSSGNNSISVKDPVMNDGEWHDIALSHYYARGYTALYIDGILAGEVTERFALCDDIVFGETERRFSEISFWRAGMNQQEMIAHHNGDMLKSSLELYVPMEIHEGRLVNLAQSTNVLQCSNFFSEP